MNGVTMMDENDVDIKSPIRRLGSTRKLNLFNNIRQQLNEQLKFLDVRMEAQIALVQELQDFFRRRGEVELDYSKSLDKLAKSLQLRHKEQRQKREQWPMFSSYSCWQQLVNQTKSLSRDHAAMSEIYSTHLVARLQTVWDDVQRIYRKCREIGFETHVEILRILQELHTNMKTYHTLQTEAKEAEKKLRLAENQRMKLQQSVPKEKLDRSKKYRLIEKEVLKRKNKYTDARLKALKAKNEYQLCLEASNTTIHKYFVEDLSDLIDCMDLGFHSVVSRALLMHVSADQGRCRAVLHNAETLSHIVNSMDSRADKQKFLEQHSAAFMIPKRLEFQGQDEDVEPELQKALHQEMESRLMQLEQRVNNLRMESEEIWKTLETAEINLLDILNTKDYDCTSAFGDGAVAFQKPENTSVKLRSDKNEIEEFYITKIREYILATSRIARLDSKAEYLRNALAKDSAIKTDTLTKSNVPKRKRIGRMNKSGRPKLFGGSLEEYLEVSGEEIPLIVRSCIRVINLYGLHHQGIFRVSGSQVEISNFKEAFERGDDPLAEMTDASDINSVAGVLKLYLRELREPLFPLIYFDHFVQLAQLDSKHDIVSGIRKFFQSLPKSVVVVIRYLFAFLNHLSEYSDENMMDAYNLAICFGPTLMPAPEDKDQVQYQNQVNELIKNIIVHHAELFPKDLGGMQYEKFITSETFEDIDVGDSPTEQVSEDPDSEVYPSEDESDTFEAIVQFDFNARSERELSLRKGDTVILYNQVSNDWWRGAVNGKTGLIPDKYISLKIKDEDRDKSEHLKSSSSEESVRKRRPSGNISLNSQLSICTQNSNTLSNITCGSDYTASTISAATASASGHSAVGGAGVGTSSGSGAAGTVAGLIQTSLASPGHPQYQTIQHASQVASAVHHSTASQSQQTQQQPAIAIVTHQPPLPSAHHVPPVIGEKLGSELKDTDYIHYDSVDHLKASPYSYHDEPHSFENSFEFVEDMALFTYETSKPSEPIYAEPTKITMNREKSPAADSGTSSNSNDEESDNVEIRPRLGGMGEPPEHSKSTLGLNRRSESTLTTGKTMALDGESVVKATDDQSDQSRPMRKYHSKSFSLSENKLSLAAGSGSATLNVFQQNRDLWQKRAAQSSYQNLTTSRILSRNRIAPDLVMDLPPSAINKETAHASRESLDTELEDMTSAERFAAQNQCTLKKNERFSNESPVYENNTMKKEVKLDVKGGTATDKPKAEVKPQEISIKCATTPIPMAVEVPTKIEDCTAAIAVAAPVAAREEESKRVSGSSTPVVLSASPAGSSTPSTVTDEESDVVSASSDGGLLMATTSVTGKELSKSPIPVRNTQKFVSQFADLHLTGGCLIKSTEGTSAASVSSMAQEQQAKSLSSFKPQVKVKPQILKKPQVLPPQTPEMQRRNAD
ncbi:SLIT-ROBO Rho GTPase-activating protein 1-like isoform X1 [Anopheles funestus]|uniref:SLIT-ROBO Rho GTPase-activating protein 1-like isoform X1 n=1 Tax=Anopheles funestus TaxID=62324 RepID=UPI0020C71FEB|nr:SLIT-ROBO Rho GTPase-activating protein 1-like isoform X1 [Anopheles funestus]XP_049295901.1 SLIT-ROBO Rho GTPase-activating protein 1-like isoform X1 [Anopheles funestus]XP_049295902.1 SLIT-ROBO Rho GTPase-activating protein 1-like isoform X1 [Anopheles funestus]XP_049295903.1 SLIT-ROBO Rho GTPase-activating protein 1-like isoform X1 [Anopheles funestus]XP_049295905.1 SLIT-ROBO Rho GTPase-activating protein 1-like isoform X1 [Anopheles funestus]XP_049295906.1 SLIT-ROBO Rho GTPase-activatin